jgi:mannosyltransferase OCH1-like enzyme
MNKTIFFFWYQGIENAPIIVKKCLKSWKYYNPSWEVVFLDKNNYLLFLSLYDISIMNYIRNNKNFSLYKISDILRLLLLFTNGGLWVDATCFCNDSLDNWLPLFINERFFVFTPFLISNAVFHSKKNKKISKVNSGNYTHDGPTFSVESTTVKDALMIYNAHPNRTHLFVFGTHLPGITA